MSKATNLLQRIKQLFDDALPTSYKLADGTDVTISLLDIGGDFTMGGLPAPEGTYTLMDGTNVIVDSTGKITSIDEPAEFAAEDHTLADGTKVQIDKVDVGGIVMQGEAKIANGDYTIEDGRIITTVDGIITEVKPKLEENVPNPAPTQAEVQQAYDDIIAAPADDQLSKLTVCVKALMDRCFGYEIKGTPEEVAQSIERQQTETDALKVYALGLESQVEAQKVKFTSQSTKVDKLEVLLNSAISLMTELAEAPAGDPPTERKVIFNGEVQKGKKGAIARYAEAATKLNESINN